MAEKGIISKESSRWGSRFGFIMVAAGAAIGLGGNIYNFPYLAYENGGGAFILTYLVIAALLAYPMVKIETCIGRAGRSDTVSSFENIVPGWGFIGWISTICALCINFFYAVVGGWILKYTVQYIVSGNMQGDCLAFYINFATSAVEPIIWTLILLVFVSVILLSGITKLVEKIAKVIMPALFAFLLICGIWALISIDGSLESIRGYLMPDFSQYTFRSFVDAATQVLFSVGIGWGIFTTLGANVPESSRVSGDSALIVICDTLVALIAGFVVIPAALAGGNDMQAGPLVIFQVMTGVFQSMGDIGRVMGILFFLAVLFAALSSLFVFFEIPMRVFERKLKMGRKKAVLVCAILIFVGNVVVSLSFGLWNNILIPFPNFQALQHVNVYDFFYCLSTYLLVPVGVVLNALFVYKAWSIKKYDDEQSNHGALKSLNGFEKFSALVISPLLMVIVFLNVFGFLP